jgi:hypothetical protein
MAAQLQHARSYYEGEYDNYGRDEPRSWEVERLPFGFAMDEEVEALAEIDPILALPHLRRTAIERGYPRDNMYYGEIRQRVVSPLDRRLP